VLEATAHKGWGGGGGGGGGNGSQGGMSIKILVLGGNKSKHVCIYLDTNVPTTTTIKIQLYKRF
jgi:hypothetical protein